MSDLSDKQNAIEILRTEHEQMREMLRIIATEEDPEMKAQLLHELVSIVQVHSELEQKLFYPFVSRHIRYEHMKRPAAEFRAVEILLSQAESVDHEELNQLLAKVGDNLEKHIFDAEELLFMRIEQRCSDVTYSLSHLSAKMHARKKELTKKLGLQKAS